MYAERSEHDCLPYSLLLDRNKRMVIDTIVIDHMLFGSSTASAREYARLTGSIVPRRLSYYEKMGRIRALVRSRRVIECLEYVNSTFTISNVDRQRLVDLHIKVMFIQELRHNHERRGGNDRGSNSGSNSGNDRGSDRGNGSGSDRGSNSGSDRGNGNGSDRGNGNGSASNSKTTSNNDSNSASDKQLLMRIRRLKTRYCFNLDIGVYSLLGYTIIRNDYYRRMVSDSTIERYIDEIVGVLWENAMGRRRSVLMDVLDRHVRSK